MYNKFSRLLFIIFIFGIGAYQVSAKSVYVDEKKGLVSIYNYSYNFSCKKGNDGVEVCYPENWLTTTGKDGRIVAYPNSNWSYTEGKDGRRVTYPNSYKDNWSYTEGKDGRRVVYPNGVGEYWSYTEGKDGRRVVYPNGVGEYWSYTEGKDGRRVVYPNGVGEYWSYVEGKDGRRVVYPNGVGEYWNKGEDSNGRKYTYPSDWTSDNGEKGFMITKYSDGGSKFDFIFRNIAQLPLITKLETVLSEQDLADYIVYTFMQESTDFTYISSTPISTVVTNSTSQTSGQCGINSIYTNGSCSCITGYQWEDPNDEKNYDCKPKNSCINGVSNSNGTCTCNSGYLWSKSYNLCLKKMTPTYTCKTLYGKTGYYTGKKDSFGFPICGCRNGTILNSTQTYCINR